MLRDERRGTAVPPRIQPTAVSCALCGSVVRVGDGGLLAVHPGKELAADGLRVVICKASRFTPDGARTLAVREAADLDALRMRAHP